MKRFIGALLLLLWVAPANAGDGKTLINQARALAGGVTAGDAAGFPITISEAGSYRLVSNLIPTNQNVNVIEITTSGGVVIDFNNFFILGGGTCTIGVNGWATSCTNTGTGKGVYSTQNTIGLLNGGILGMGSLGVDMSPLAGSGYNVENFVVAFCGGGGIDVARGARLLDLLVGYNTGTGINVDRGGRLINVSSSGNLGDGISHAGSGEIQDGTANENSADGIDAEDNTSVRGNRTSGNGAAGIDVGYASLVLENLSNYNATYGLNFGGLAGTTVGYGSNAMTLNATANVNGTGTQLGSNICGTGLCP